LYFFPNFPSSFLFCSYFCFFPFSHCYLFPFPLRSFLSLRLPLISFFSVFLLFVSSSCVSFSHVICLSFISSIIFHLFYSVFPFFSSIHIYIFIYHNFLWFSISSQLTFSELFNLTMWRTQL
jgi:hypothetical protein